MRVANRVGESDVAIRQSRTGLRSVGACYGGHLRSPRGSAKVGWPCHAQRLWLHREPHTLLRQGFAGHASRSILSASFGRPCQP